MIAPARVAAYEILTDVSAGRRDLPAAIAAARATLRDDRDRGLAAEIATGVQRQRGTLDYLIAHFSKRALDRLDPEIVEILRLSAYQLLHLTRVPAAAVVDDAVNLAGRVGKRSASGFVNAVLRKISRERRSLPLPPRPQAPPQGFLDGGRPDDRVAALDYFSITLSHPRWLAARWLDRFGFEEAEAWLRFNNTQAPLTLRANALRVATTDLPGRLAAEGVHGHPGQFAPGAFIVDEGQPLGGTGLPDGWFVVQDEASQLIPLLAGPTRGARVLDTCASPGGKATALAAAIGGPMGNQGLLVACDVRNRRISLLRSTVHASGAGNIRLVQADLLRPLPFADRFDCVLVDAPCSGLGILRRDPDIRWRRTESDLPRLASAQRTMLGHAAAAVAPGGRLVYATCSSEPEENEEVVDAFLRDTENFAAVDPRRFARAPALDSPATVPETVIDDRGHLRTSPHSHGLEAFFGAVFHRRP